MAESWGIIISNSQTEKAGAAIKENRQIFRSLALLTQLGLSVMVPVFLCIFAGRWIDSRFGTNWTLVFLFLGFLAGISCAWRLAAGVSRMEKREREAERLEQLEEWRQKHTDGTEVRRPKRKSRVIKEEEKQYGENNKGPGC